MAFTRLPSFFHFPLLLFTVIFAALIIQQGIEGSRAQRLFNDHISPSEKDLHFQNSRRLMIGSVAPTCTYNECRGCRYKCRAEQVPVEGNDPINSPYHYKCVCHR